MRGNRTTPTPAYHRRQHPNPIHVRFLFHFFFAFFFISGLSFPQAVCVCKELVPIHLPIHIYIYMGRSNFFLVHTAVKCEPQHDMMMEYSKSVTSHKFSFFVVVVIVVCFEIAEGGDSRIGQAVSCA